MSKTEPGSPVEAKAYETPELTVLGTFSSLTAAKPGSKSDAQGGSPPNTKF